MDVISTEWFSGTTNWNINGNTKCTWLNCNNRYHKLAIVTCWYGPYPWYFPYFIHSCKYNPTIDFLIITDNSEEIPDKPYNVKVFYWTIKKIKAIASSRLGFTVSLDYPYKLNDFKPAYGLVFQDLLEEYGFWAYADIDIVYGDIRNFLTKEILNEFEVVNCRHDYTTGAFCLYRNNRHINRLFMQSRDYVEILSRAEHFCFDECSFLYDELSKGNSILCYPNCFQSMTYVVRKAEAEGKIKAYFDFIILEGTPGNVKWRNGKIFYKDKYEVMLYHLVKFKKECRNSEVLNPIPDTFEFTCTNIVKTV